MRILRALALVGLLAALLAPVAVAAPVEQVPDPASLLEASGMAMDGIESMRFSGPMAIKVDGGGGSSFSMTMSMSGELQKPDRVRMTMDLGMIGMSGEIVMIGDDGWMRMGDTPWEEMPMDQSMMSMSPMSFAQSNREFGRYVLNASLVDAGQFYRVSGDLDIAAAIEAGSESAAMMTGGMTGMMMDFSGATARVTFIIEKSTQYMHEMEFIMALPMAEMGADMSLQMNMGFSGFNDPTISITAPDIPTTL